MLKTSLKITATLLAFLLYACNQDAGTNTSTADVDTLAQAQDSATLGFLKAFEGKYPQEINLLEHPELQARLKKMLGSEYDTLKKFWQVETPVEINGNLVYTWGMEAHSGGNPEAVFMADMDINRIYIGIRKDTSVRIYQEDENDTPPQRLLDWSSAE
jgi:hypothetical protein